MFDVLGYGISESDLHSKNSDGTYKLLTLDIDFGNKCSLNCPHCFRRNSNFKSECNSISIKEIKNIILQGKEIGLKCVKIIGAGEPFENSELIPFINFLDSLNIITAIFTKGHIIGNDDKVSHYFGKYGYYTSESLFEFLKAKNVSLLIGLNSFNEELQANFVGEKTEVGKITYLNSRNRTLELSIKYGFNEVKNDKTRLALICAPIKPENLNEVLDIYKFSRTQNIYALNCPTALSGLGKVEYLRTNKLIDSEIYIEKLKSLYIDIYSWGIENGYLSIDDIKKYGISLYAGGHPCNQVAAGMYITLNGKVARCPGRDDDSFMIENDVRSKPLKEIWMNSKNYQLAAHEGKFNFHCIARDGHLFKNPHKFYSDIEKVIISKYVLIKSYS